MGRKSKIKAQRKRMRRLQEVQRAETIQKQELNRITQSWDIIDLESFNIQEETQPNKSFSQSFVKYFTSICS